jgi:hypothetical protein
VIISILLSVFYLFLLGKFLENGDLEVKFQIVTVSMEMTAFWDIAACGLKVD